MEEMVVYVKGEVEEFSVLGSLWQDWGKDEIYSRVEMPSGRIFYVLRSELSETEQIALSCLDDHLDHVEVEDEYYDQSCTCRDHVVNERECYASLDTCYHTRVKTDFYGAPNISITIKLVEEDVD